MHDTNASKVHPWIMLIGVILLIAGIYGAARTAINLLAFEKYPTEKIFQWNLFNNPAYYGVVPPKESDCFYPQYFYKPDGLTMREPNALEKKMQEDQRTQCIANVDAARHSTKVADVSQSLLYLALGAGILAFRKIFFLNA